MNNFIAYDYFLKGLQQSAKEDTITLLKNNNASYTDYISLLDHYAILWVKNYGSGKESYYKWCSSMQFCLFNIENTTQYFGDDVFFSE